MTTETELPQEIMDAIDGISVRQCPYAECREKFKSRKQKLIAAIKDYMDSLIAAQNLTQKIAVDCFDKAVEFQRVNLELIASENPNYLSEKSFEEMTNSELFSVMAHTALSNPARCRAAEKYYNTNRRSGNEEKPK